MSFVERYAAHGVDAEAAIRAALSVPVSIHCWQADDVVGLEKREEGVSGGGILATGNHPGRARNGDEMREDFDEVLALVPGRHRLNLHAIYAETTAPVPRDELRPEHFSGWMAWAKSRGIALDFNPTYFAHPRSERGSLSSSVEQDRQFWIRHGIASRQIAAEFARSSGEPSVNNHWIPDGAKDSPIDRRGPRERLKASLDEILAPAVDGCQDTVESKLFGIGVEDYTVGSHDFYTHYALQKGIGYCLDMGHFHPTETITDKISSLLLFHPWLLLHVSRPIRWDSDHIVLFNDDLRAVFQDIHRLQAWDCVKVALDYFDASVPRVLAYAIGIRNVRKAILYAMLEPVSELKRLETEGSFGSKLAYLEEQKTLPFGAAWEAMLEMDGKPGGDWFRRVLTRDR
jgi:L-rhamnose isomerase